MAYIIVVDGGGTKTKGRSYSISGRMISEHIEGFSNPMVDLELSVYHIACVIKELASGKPPEAVILGIAGSAQQSVHTLLKESVQMHTHAFVKHAQIILVDDLTLSYYATFRGREGILGLLGTGSALLTRLNGEWFRMGGYGHILGDEGSGYVLAVETVKEAIQRAYNGNSTLAKKIIQYLELETLEDIKEIVYRSPKVKLASLSKKVFDWEKEEALTPIIEKQIDLFSSLAMTMLSRVYSSDADRSIQAGKCQMSLIGGMVQNNQFYFNRIKTQIQKMTITKGDLEIACPEVDACEGGLYLYNEYKWRI